MSTQTASYIEAIEHLPTGATLRLPHVRWEDYEQLLADLGDDYHVRAKSCLRVARDYESLT